MLETLASISGFLPQAFANADESRIFDWYWQDVTESPNVARRIKSAAELLVLDHFGTITLDNFDEVVSRGMANANEFFSNYDGSNDGQEPWFPPFASACLMGTYAYQWEALVEITRPVDYDWWLCYVGGLEFEVQYLYKVMANYLKGAPIDIPAEVEGWLGEAKKVRPKTYIAMWNHLMAGDNEGFVKELQKSLKRFTSRKKPDLAATYGSEWIARTESIFTNIALRNGFTIPPLKPEYRAVMLVKDLEMLPR